MSLLAGRGCAAEPLDVAGVGAGPSNLSLAALLAPVGGLRSLFMEQKPRFDWHAGMLFPGSAIQVSFLKDLVMPVDPTSRYSFMAFLAAQKRYYRFLCADFPAVSRLEFSQYLDWVASSLASVRLGEPVREVTHEAGSFVVHTAGRPIRARHLVLGTGRSAHVPPFAARHLGAHVFHANELLCRRPQFAGRRVAVVGGGQSGAEVVDELLSASSLPDRLTWISQRGNFLPLDDSPFANEWFNPSYSDHFYSLPREARLRLLAEQRLASDGIALSLLRQIYRRLYALEFLEGRPDVCHLRPATRLVDVDRSHTGYKLSLRDLTCDRASSLEVDYLVLATGYRYRPPDFLAPLAGRLHWSDDAWVVGQDFAIEWDGPPGNRIYVQNGALQSRGIADPNLSLMAWRSATIVNSIAGRSVYGIDGESSALLREPPGSREGERAHAGIDRIARA